MQIILKQKTVFLQVTTLKQDILCSNPEYHAWFSSSCMEKVA